MADVVGQTVIYDIFQCIGMKLRALPVGNAVVGSRAAVQGDFPASFFAGALERPVTVPRAVYHSSAAEAAEKNAPQRQNTVISGDDGRRWDIFRNRCFFSETVGPGFSFFLCQRPERAVYDADIGVGFFGKYPFAAVFPAAFSVDAFPAFVGGTAGIDRIL